MSSTNTPTNPPRMTLEEARIKFPIGSKVRAIHNPELGEMTVIGMCPFKEETLLYLQFQCKRFTENVELVSLPDPAPEPPMDAPKQLTYEEAVIKFPIGSFVFCPDETTPRIWQVNRILKDGNGSSLELYIPGVGYTASPSFIWKLVPPPPSIADSVKQPKTMDAPKPAPMVWRHLEECNVLSRARIVAAEIYPDVLVRTLDTYDVSNEKRDIGENWLHNCRLVESDEPGVWTVVRREQEPAPACEKTVDTYLKNLNQCLDRLNDVTSITMPPREPQPHRMQVADQTAYDRGFDAGQDAAITRIERDLGVGIETAKECVEYVRADADCTFQFTRSRNARRILGMD